MTKKITIFLPSMRGGGAERAMMTLANGLSRLDFEVDLVLAKAEGPYLKDISDDVNVVDLNKSRVLYTLAPLIRYIRNAKPNVILSTHNHANIVTVVARILSGLYPKLVLGQSNTLSLISGGKPRLTQKIIPQLAKIFYASADLIVAVSRGVADDLVDYFQVPKEKVKVIYDPVVTDDLYIKAEESLDHPWFRDKSVPVIIGVGRLTPVKDFFTLIKAFSLVKKQVDAKLLILGEGECRADLEELVKELGLVKDVSMPGFVSNPFPYMRSADLFVLSSRTEGLPNALIQAMALGVRVVSTNCKSGPEEILENGRFGILTEVGNFESLAEAIVKSLNNKDHNAENLIEYCKKKFGEKSIVDQFSGILG